MTSSSVYNNTYIKIKTGTYGHKVYTIFLGLNVAGDGVECKSFTIVSISS